MAEHANVDLLRRGYGAFAKEDVATLMEVFSDDAVWHQPGTNLLSGEYGGKAAVLAFLGRLAPLSGGTFRVELHDLLANDQHGVALSRQKASRQGKQLDTLVVQVYHFRDGKVTEAWNFFQDQRGYDEFWS